MLVVFKFLFWNLNRRPISSLVAELAREFDIDVIILAECGIDSDTLTKQLSSTVGFDYSEIFSPKPRIRMFVRFDPSWIALASDPPYAMIRYVTHPDVPNFLIVAAHMPSKLHADDTDQLTYSIRLRQEIDRVESELGHGRIVVVGDLNMNPFEAGVVSSDGFHGVMHRDIASRISRTVRSEERKFFYNPMLGYFGDRTTGPPGTYYYGSTNSVAYFWNMFDQVLFSADLMDAFDDDNLEIVTTVGETSLVDHRGLPDSTIASDHLPLVFGLDFT